MIRVVEPLVCGAALLAFAIWLADRGHGALAAVSIVLANANFARRPMRQDAAILVGILCFSSACSDEGGRPLPPPVENIATCGDNIVSHSEQCEPGVILPGNAYCEVIGAMVGFDFYPSGFVRCNDDCTYNFWSCDGCGNGVVDSLIGEQCDDGNWEDGDGCTRHCFREEDS